MFEQLTPILESSESGIIHEVLWSKAEGKLVRALGEATDVCYDR